MPLTDYSFGKELESGRCLCLLWNSRPKTGRAKFKSRRSTFSGKELSCLFHSCLVEYYNILSRANEPFSITLLGSYSSILVSKAFQESPAHNDLSYLARRDSLATRLASVGFLDCRGRCYNPCPAPFLILNLKSDGQSPRGKRKTIVFVQNWAACRAGILGSRVRINLPLLLLLASSLAFATQLFGEVRLWSVTLQGPATLPTFQGHQR